MPGNNNGKDKVILKVPADAEGIFIRRPNRFIAEVSLEGEKVEAHVHDSGRLGELLFPGNRVLLKEYDNPGRRTRWEVIASRYHDSWIFTNSKFHREVSERILKDPEISPFPVQGEIRAEVKSGKSRIDFLVESNPPVWVEVKGCTLEIDGVATFPDAPTTRGRRHVEELMSLMSRGDRAALLFLIFHRDVRCFSPNTQRDPDFSQTFYRALDEGLEVYPAVLSYDGESIRFHRYIPVCQREMFL